MRTAFVLSSGGSLGAVQIGMLQALADHRLGPDLLVGASAGALNAAFIAGHGFTHDALDRLAACGAVFVDTTCSRSRSARQLLALVGARPSLCAAGGLHRLVSDNLTYDRLEDASIPIADRRHRRHLRHRGRPLPRPPGPGSARVGRHPGGVLHGHHDRRARAATTRWLDDGNHRLPHPERFLPLHRHLTRGAADHTTRPDADALAGRGASMTNAPTLVVVGASLAGAKAAEAARDAGHDGRIVLIGEEATVPYERPPLSKAVLRGEAELAVTACPPRRLLRRTRHRARHRPRDRPRSDARQIQVDGGDDVAFDTLVLATGAAPRRLRVPGADLAGVHLLRTADDAIRLRAAIQGATRVAVVGAGWIGSEVAASARQMGTDVVLIGPRLCRCTGSSARRSVRCSGPCTRNTV